MVQVEWTGPALADLRGVYEYIAHDSPRYAQLTVEKIQKAAGRAAQFPKTGHVLPEFPDEPYRQVLVGMYRIIYREDEKKKRVLIMGVIHGRRDVPKILEGR